MKYSTQKISVIQDPKLSLLYWSVLFALFLSYLWGLYNDPQTWMEPDIGHGSITIDVEGSTFSTYKYGNPEVSPKEWTETSRRVFDANELRIPSQESGSIFLATSVTPHLEQHRGIDTFCGDPTKPCISDRDCRETDIMNRDLKRSERVHKSYYGTDTNVCVDGYCLVRSWCPIQLPKAFKIMDKSMQNWKLFFKAFMSFAKYKQTRKNYNANMEREPEINEFSIKSILDHVGTNFNEIKKKGIIIILTVSFQCLEWEDECMPTFEFKRMDDGSGISWIYTQYRPVLLVGDFELPESRTTWELKGIRIVIAIDGAMYRFSWVGLVLSFGSVIGLSVTANKIADFALLNLHKDRDSFVLQKYRFVDDWRVLDDVREQLKMHLTNLGYY